MKQLITFLRYTVDFLKHGELHYFMSSVRYMLLKKTTRTSGIYRSSLGKFYVRKGTLDFQFANYAYEWNVKKFVYRHVKNYNRFLDVGANIGTYSILFAKEGLKGCAFEPVKTNYDVFVKNIELNDLQDYIKPLNIGLGNFTGKEEFTLDPVNTGASHSSHVENKDALDGGRTLVEITTLDDIVGSCNFDPQKDKVFIKIDVEGMEAQVLEGGRRFLQSFPEIMLVMESVHSGKDKLAALLHAIDENFQLLEVDDLNMGAVKTRTKSMGL